MALWLNRRLAVDLSTVDAGSDKRKQREEEEHYLLWLLLVPTSDVPTAHEIERVINVLSRAGFEPSCETGLYTVFPADISDDEYDFSTVSGIAGQLATEGGGVLFGGRGAGIALVCDPEAKTRREAVRRMDLEDEIEFGEFSIWMPRPEPKGVTHDEAAAAILAVLPRIQQILRSQLCFAVTTDDLATLFLRWAYHRLIAETRKLSELFWYQSFLVDDVSTLMLDDYRRAGCSIQPVEEGQVVVQLTDLPSAGLGKLDAARDRWLYSLIPRRVC